MCDYAQSRCSPSSTQDLRRIDNGNTVIGSRAFGYEGVDAWNSFSKHSCNCTSSCTFESKLIFSDELLLNVGYTLVMSSSVLNMAHNLFNSLTYLPTHSYVHNFTLFGCYSFLSAMVSLEAMMLQSWLAHQLHNEAEVWVKQLQQTLKWVAWWIFCIQFNTRIQCEWII